MRKRKWAVTLRSRLRPKRRIDILAFGETEAVVAHVCSKLDILNDISSMCVVCSMKGLIIHPPDLYTKDSQRPKASETGRPRR
jgi:hypothetical protein